MSATRGESYVCMSVDVDVFISRPGLREWWLILFALYFYPQVYPSTHLPTSMEKKKKRMCISLDIFPQMMQKINNQPPVGSFSAT